MKILESHFAHQPDGMGVYVAIQLDKDNFEVRYQHFPNHYTPTRYLLNRTAESGMLLPENLAALYFPRLFTELEYK